MVGEIEKPRHQRRELEREEKKLGKNKSGNIEKFFFGGVVLLLIAGIGYFLSKAPNVSTNTPGENAEDLGRDHIGDIAGINYSSNPPSSGPHFPIWAKRGVYDRLVSDGYLIHSLEHGYIIVSYNCERLSPSAFSWVPTVLAHDEPAPESTDSGELLKHMKFSPHENESWITPENQPEVEIELPQAFSSDACRALVGTLSTLLDDWERIVIVPRVDLDSTIALTAWGKVMKLDSVDMEKIKSFVVTYHNKGPENTSE